MTNLVQIKKLSDAPERFSDVVALIEKSFGYDQNHSYAIDFYPLFEKSNWQNSHLLLKENRVIGHIGYKSYQLTQELGKVCFLGGIAIDERQRGHGYFKFLFENTFKNYQDHKIFFLWSDLHEFYQNFGFKPAFTFYELYQSPLEQKDFIKKNITEITISHWSEIKKLYEHKAQSHFSIKRTDQNWSDLKKITSASWYLAIKNNRVVGYAVKNKGMDLNDIVHEFAIDDTSLFVPLCSLGKVWISSDEKKKFSVPEDLSIAQIGCLAMGEILSRPFFISGLDSI